MQSVSVVHVLLLTHWPVLRSHRPRSHMTLSQGSGLQVLLISQSAGLTQTPSLQVPRSQITPSHVAASLTLPAHPPRLMPITPVNKSRPTKKRVMNRLIYII